MCESGSAIPHIVQSWVAAGDRTMASVLTAKCRCSPFHCRRLCWVSAWAWWSPWRRRTNPGRRTAPQWLLSSATPWSATADRSANWRWSGCFSRWRCNTTRGMGFFRRSHTNGDTMLLLLLGVRACVCVQLQRISMLCSMRTPLVFKQHVLLKKNNRCPSWYSYKVTSLHLAWRYKTELKYNSKILVYVLCWVGSYVGLIGRQVLVVYKIDTKLCQTYSIESTFKR